MVDAAIIVVIIVISIVLSALVVFRGRNKSLEIEEPIRLGAAIVRRDRRECCVRVVDGLQRVTSVLPYSMTSKPTSNMFFGTYTSKHKNAGSSQSA